MQKKAEHVLYVIFFLLTMLSVLLCMRSDRSGRSPSGLQRVRIEGSFCVNGREYEPLTGESRFDVSRYNTVTVRGHFSQDIPENKQLLLRLNNVRAVLSVNGRTVYENTREAKSFCRSPGNGWTAVSSPGIKTEDEVEFQLSNVYKNGNSKIFSLALEELYMGYENDLARFIFRKSAVSIVFGFLTIPLGFLLFIIGVFIRQINRERIFSLSLFCISVGTWILADPNYMSFVADSPSLVLAIGQIAQFLQLVSVTKFACTLTRGRVRAAVSAVHWMTFLLFAAAVVCQLLGVADYYDFTFAFVILCGIVCVSILWALAVETLRGDSFCKKTLLSIFPLGIFSLTEQAGWFLGHYYTGYFTQLGFVIFLGIQAVYSIREAQAVVYRLEQAQKTEKELAENRISMMLSQIQPHFLYNSLTAIVQLCRKDAAKAEEAMIAFSKYLRANMDSLTQKKPVPFETELRHVENYLFLEKIRFGDELKIAYDVQTAGFFLPPLTVQPLVENAVKHGIEKKEEGGAVTIRTRETQTEYLVEVSDDGAGFDVEQSVRDGRSHIGIASVKSRIEALAGGTLEVKSHVGDGTTVTIKIPKQSEGREPHEFQAG